MTVAELDILFPKPRYPSRSAVIEMILRRYLDNAIPSEELEENEPT